MQLMRIIIWLLLPVTVSAQTIQLKNLRCENYENPIGIDVPAPMLSWQIGTEQKNFLQSAYQVIVSDNATAVNKLTGNYWNSNKIASRTSIGIRYAGKKLQPGKTYYWRVRIWDKNNQPAAWSTTASFVTGLYTKKDWSGAQWIGYEDLPDTSIVTPGVHLTDLKPLGEKLKTRSTIPYFRKEFPVTKKVVSALAFISGLGQYEMTLNGQKVSQNFLTPGWTYYDKRVFYNVYDITNKLNKGQNAIGVLVGNGFYNINRERYVKMVIAFGLPKLLCKIQVTYEDGSTAVILSDGSWKTTPGPITFSSIYGGEDYDAQLEQPGWDAPAFDDAQWKNALLVKPPAGVLEAEKTYPVTINDSFTVKTITQPAPGIYVYDFGQNASGIIELKVKGKKGQTVKLIPAELLNDKNLANQNATGKPYSFSYTLKGEGVETWRPRFTYYGFRYVQVESAVPIISLTSLHTGSSEPVAGTFTCSNDLFNRIHDLIRWAIKSNLQSVVTDCPHREKLSWLEQDHLMGGSIKSNFNVYHLYRKLVYDMMDAQTPEGLVPDIAPEFVVFKDNGFGFRDSPEWGSAGIIVPWLLYTWYGDTAILRTAYPMMKKYVAYLKSHSNGHIISYGLGDWFDYGPNRPGVAQLTPKELTATAIYYYDIHLLGKMALLLNDRAEAARLTTWATEVKQAFNKKFYNSDTHVYSTGSQTAMAMPLCVGLVDVQNRKAVLKNLVDSITLTGKKLTAGDVGYHFLVQALQKGGASQLLYDMNYRDDVPGYGYQLKKGATALTESWPALKEVSNNHLMLGHIMEWFYNGLAGIDQSPGSVAYKEITIKPEVVGDISFVKAGYESPYGTIVSDWKKENDVFTLHVQIPANTTAIIYLPVPDYPLITVNGKGIRINKDVKVTATANGRTIVKIGSGDYVFVVKPFATVPVTIMSTPTPKPATRNTFQTSPQLR